MDEIPDDEQIFEGVVGHDGALAVTRAALREGDVHILYEGPPGCGKSALLMAIEERIPGAIYRDGKSMSASKVRDRLKEDPSIIAIDEIDALDRRAYDELALPLEHGRVQKDTTQESYDVEIGTQVIAACNDVMALPQNIRSRFRKVKLTEYTDDDYLELCETMLIDTVDWIEDPRVGREIGEIVMDETGETDPRDARDVARLAGSREKVPEIAKAFVEPGAEIDSDPITPEEVARAKPAIGRQRLTEMAMQEQELREMGETSDEGTEIPDEIEEEADDEGETPEDLDEEERERVEASIQDAIEAEVG